MSKLVILRPHTTYARVRSWDSEYEICGGKSDIWTRFSDGMPVFPVHIIPPMLRTNIHQRDAFNRSANWRSLAAYEKQSCFGSREHSVENYFHFLLKGLITQPVGTGTLRTEISFGLPVSDVGIHQSHTPYKVIYKWKTWGAVKDKWVVL